MAVDVGVGLGVAVAVGVGVNVGKGVAGDKTRTLSDSDVASPLTALTSTSPSKTSQKLAPATPLMVLVTT